MLACRHSKFKFLQSLSVLGPRQRKLHSHDHSIGKPRYTRCTQIPNQIPNKSQLNYFHSVRAPTPQVTTARSPTFLHCTDLQPRVVVFKTWCKTSFHTQVHCDGSIYHLIVLVVAAAARQFPLALVSPANSRGIPTPQHTKQPSQPL